MEPPRVHFCKAQIAILARVVSRSEPIYREDVDDDMRDQYRHYDYVLEVEHDYKLVQYNNNYNLYKYTYLVLEAKFSITFCLK